MEKAINMELVDRLPQKAYGEVKNAARTMFLTRKFCNMMSNGATMEETITAHLPATDPERTRNTVQQLAAGVDSVYGFMNEEVSEKWVREHMNNVMINLSNKERAAHLENMISLAPAGTIDEETLKRIEAIKASGDATDEDVSFLADAAQNMIAGNAGVLKRSSVLAMEKVMHYLRKDIVLEFANAGVNTAKAYAAACYVMDQCGENPWSVDKEINGQTMPYTIGVIAATNIESSRLMSLYCTGKIKLAVLHEKLERLFRRALTFICEQTVRAIAMGLQILTGITIADWLAGYFFYTLHFGPWVTIIGATVLATLAATQVVTTQDYVDMLNMIWNLVKMAWDGAKSVWNSVFHKNVSDESEVSVSDNSADESKDDEAEDTAEEFSEDEEDTLADDEEDEDEVK